MKSSAKPDWIAAGIRSGWPLQPARPAVGDRAREQLLDRPVDHRQDHEHDRPAERDQPVVAFDEDVAGGRQVGEGEDPGRRDPDRQDPRARARTSRSGSRRRPDSAEAAVPVPPGGTSSRAHPDRTSASSTGTASASRPPRRTERADEPAGPVVEVPGRVAELSQVGAAGDVERSPQRLVGHRHEQPALGDPRHLGDRRLGIDRRARAPRWRPPDRTRRRRTAATRPASPRNSRFGRAARAAHSAASLGSSRSMPTTRPDRRAAAPTARSARPRRSRRRAPSPAPPAANSSSSVRSKPAISRRTTGLVEPYLSNVLPVGTAGRRSYAAAPRGRRSVGPAALGPGWPPRS